MEADSGEKSRRRSLLDVVVQNLRGIGAVPIGEFLGAQSLLHAGSPGGQDRPELSNPSFPTTIADTSSHSGSSDIKGVGGVSKVLTAPASAPPPSASEPMPLVTDMDEYTREIEECCMEWRAGQVKPYWLTINEPKFGHSTSPAISLQLTA